MWLRCVSVGWEPVESKRGDGQLTACEVLLFHHEDMGIPSEIAKLGIRHGMWGAVKKIEPGLRSYQKHRANGGPLSRCAFMAQINTKVSVDYLRCLESSASSSSSEVENQDSSSRKPGGNMPRLLLIGGAIVLACTLDQGLLTKAVIFGVARRLAKIGRWSWFGNYFWIIALTSAELVASAVNWEIVGGCWISQLLDLFWMDGSFLFNFFFPWAFEVACGLRLEKREDDIVVFMKF